MVYQIPANNGRCNINLSSIMKKTKKDYLKEMDDVIKAVEKLQENKSITGVYLDEGYIRAVCQVLYNVKETIKNDGK